MAAKILLVEDDNNLREIYEARLEAEGYTIVTAKDGEEALVVAKAEKPDLVVSDVMMPRISGFEMLDILRNTAELKDTKVIMLTALGQADDQTRATSLGADRYLVKSQVTLEDIVKAAHDLIEGLAPAPVSAAPSGGMPTVQAPAVPPVPANPASPVLPATPPTLTPVPASPVPNPVHDEPAGQQTPTHSEPSTPAVPAPAPPVVAAPVRPPMPPVPVPVTPRPAVQAPVSPHVSPMPTPTATSSAPVAPITNHEDNAPLPPAAPQAKAPEAQAEAEAQADATPTADEQAAMHTQIEDFINNNLTHPEATTRQAASTPTPATSTSADEALLASAVENLSGPKSAATLAPEVHEAPAIPVAPPSDNPAPNDPTPPKPEEPHSPAGNNSVTIANKKIIQPLKSDKPGLDELLAREEAKERAGSLGTANPSMPPTPPMPSTNDMPPMQPPASSGPPSPDSLPPSPNSGPDPNSIAL